jgi:glycosyltransferase involved in cell wall biosynthesis
MIHELYPEFFDLTDITTKFKRDLAHRAAHIIAISEHTRQDILRIYHLPPERVSVIYHGHRPPVGLPQPQCESDPYLLFVGPRAIYKNFYFLLQAARDLLLKTPNLKLKCVGSAPLSAPEKLYIDRLGLSPQVIHTGTVDDESLWQLYQGAKCLVFPSLYEGFGMPILEAFACSCPVISSSASALPEVGGDACIYFDPKDVRALRDALTRLIADQNLRSQLIAAGSARVKEFTWNKVAERTQNVYSQLIS